MEIFLAALKKTGHEIPGNFSGPRLLSGRGALEMLVRCQQLFLEGAPNLSIVDCDGKIAAIASEYVEIQRP